ncbi:hypothetical protein KBTX_02206 [wastewater metagenome]|uniref:Uncharacterized protein n=2 Tax=unclassified sequences TaxID=12908 RepID=A0A5B8RD53_9ZZZZ|nr:MULTISPECIES: hypothetical protein [Arhodomonas]MCS4505199.1 hypothetical protein [Arhodomonas aquaeolei]QEA05878.1 hypothetical protein KBTEX_02206 [uncultured organism]
MADNTVQITLKANVADFEKSIKAGVGTFDAEMKGAARTANTQVLLGIPSRLLWSSTKFSTNSVET